MRSLLRRRNLSPANRLQLPLPYKEAIVTQDNEDPLAGGDRHYEEGKRAYLKCIARFDNPNQEGSDDAKAWYAGYDSEAAEEYGRTP